MPFSLNVCKKKKYGENDVETPQKVYLSMQAFDKQELANT